eukprot:TRINITY_DN76898_c0_g1_i1.p1 TRINITY_DN76898_c0_g1~~TRINITY_DN76898_c0_g1_i1.p1  ORF type:complete len:241 (+),score=19.11 TRINITY_DN76898_c0_g1_i1:26-724(+)
MNMNDWRVHKSPTVTSTALKYACILINIVATAVYLLYEQKAPQNQEALSTQSLCLILFGIGYAARTIWSTCSFRGYEVSIGEFTITITFVPLVLFSLGYCHINQANTTLNTFGQATTGISLFTFFYITGSIFGTLSEWQRTQFKKNPRNKGKLFTGGLYSLCRHPNYFGDVLLFTGWGLLSGSWINLWLPLVMFFNFLFAHVPDMEKYMKERYKAEWPEYERKTKSLVPFVC